MKIPNRGNSLNYKEYHWDSSESGVNLATLASILVSLLALYARESTKLL